MCKRYVVDEYYEEHTDYFAGVIYKVWTYTYNDGYIETVEQKERIRK